MHLCLSLAPNKTISVLALLNVFAVGEGGPKIREEVGLLLDVLLAEDGSDGPGRLFSVVEWDATGVSVS